VTEGLLKNPTVTANGKNQTSPNPSLSRRGLKNISLPCQGEACPERSRRMVGAEIGKPKKLIKAKNF
jgi:hypothetical protein